MACEIRRFGPGEPAEGFLEGFAHDVHIGRKWVREGGGWTLRDADGRRFWSEEKRRWIARYLREQTQRGGCAFGAYEGERLIGFASADGPVLRGFANLTMLFVDDRFQGCGVGRALLAAVCRVCVGRARRLYISAIPSRETIAFYRAMGCADVPLMPEFMDSEEDRPMGLELR